MHRASGMNTLVKLMMVTIMLVLFTATFARAQLAPVNECSDGIDNDGDGLADFADTGGAHGAALGCFGPNAQETTTNYGFTLFTPSADTHIIYVSSSQGNDANTCLSAQAPCKTIARGKSLLRYGYPDWLLLKRGDTFYEAIGRWYNAGRSATEMQIVGSYGSSPLRPVLKTGIAPAVIVFGDPNVQQPIAHVAFVGLRFYAHTRDPDNTAEYLGPQTTEAEGIKYQFPGNDLLIEDCEISHYTDDIVMMGYANAPITGLRLRRNIFRNAYGISQPGANLPNYQAIYFELTQAPLIEDNLFDHNGWYQDIQSSYGWMGMTKFNHSVYVSRNNPQPTFRGNIVSRADGVYLGGGAKAENNLFLQTAIALNIVDLGAGHSIVHNNVVVETLQAHPISGFDPPAVWGLVVGNPDGATVSENILAHSTNANQSYCNCTSSQNLPAAALNSSVHHNTIYDWPGANLSTVPNFDYNIVWNPTPAFAHNLLGSNVPLTHAACTAAAYNASLGGAATLDDFLARVKQRSHLQWNNAYTAQAAIAFFRDCFEPTQNIGGAGAVPYSPGGSPLSPTCQGADTNNDGLLSQADFTAYLALFDQHNPRADINHDLAYNILDFTAFLQLYAACTGPNPPPGAAPPEHPRRAR